MNAFSKVLILVIIAVLIGGGILVWQYWWMLKEEVKVPEVKAPEEKIEKEAVPEEVIEDETVNWIYQNKKYGFEMWCPKWWNVYELNEAIIFQDAPYRSVPDEWFTIELNKDEYDFSNYDFSKEEVVDKITGKEDIIISGEKAFKYRFYPKSEYYILRTSIILNHKGQGWILSYGGLSHGLENQILSTFRFLEPVSLTEVIRYIPTEAPDEVCEGACDINAFSTIRRDAWRCGIGNFIKDPCFVFEINKSLVCEPYPPTGDKGILLKLIEPLPEPNISQDKFGEGWAWLIELEDGSICRFITGATATVNGKRVNFSCGKFEIAILGNLQVGPIWKAEKALLELVEGKWQAKSVELVPIKKVWQ